MPRGETLELLTDGHTLWVNDGVGMCIGRFGARGVDIHRSAAEQVAGAPQCLDCIHDLPPAEAWDRFVSSMAKHHAVRIGPEWKPAFVTLAEGATAADRKKRGGTAPGRRRALVVASRPGVDEEGAAG
ncbi:hypothetical protein [Methylobacterium radiotolerans]|uniref:hypothetical protein n=1 Tax=Methylobacterium radiotolerans TaxID=31998 RepID=UPI0038D106D1